MGSEVRALEGEQIIKRLEENSSRFFISHKPFTSNIDYHYYYFINDQDD